MAEDDEQDVRDDLDADERSEEDLDVEAEEAEGGGGGLKKMIIILVLHGKTRPNLPIKVTAAEETQDLRIVTSTSTRGDSKREPLTHQTRHRGLTESLHRAQQITGDRCHDG